MGIGLIMDLKYIILHYYYGLNFKIVITLNNWIKTLSKGKF